MLKTIKTLIIATVLGTATLVATAESNTNSLFNAKELSVSLGTGYVVDTAAAFQQDYSFNLTAGTEFFYSKYFGGQVSAPFYQTEGASFSEISAGLLARLPLGHVAPYVGFGGVYQVDSDKDWAYIAKAGIEFRKNSKWIVFAEYQVRNSELDIKDSSASLLGGVKLIF